MSTKNLKICVVNNPTDYQKVIAIRSIVFMGEQDLPYSVEFGPNEFCNTHILATLDGELAGTVRIHQFHDFAKLERMAVMPEFRETKLPEMLRNKALEICAAKGIGKIYALCRPELLSHWADFGYQRIENVPNLKVSNMDLIPILVQIDEARDILKFTDHPERLIDQEGEWRENCMYFDSPLKYDDKFAIIIRNRNELRQSKLY